MREIYLINKKTGLKRKISTKSELKSFIANQINSGTDEDWEAEIVENHSSGNSIDESVINEYKDRGDIQGDSLNVKHEPYVEKEYPTYEERKDALGYAADFFPNAATSQVGGKGPLSTSLESFGDVLTMPFRGAYGIAGNAVNKAMGKEWDNSLFGRNTREGYEKGTPVLNMAYDPTAVGSTAFGFAKLKNAPLGLKSMYNAASGAANAMYNEGDGTDALIGAGVGASFGAGASKGSTAVRNSYANESKKLVKEIARKLWRGPRGKEVSESELYKYIATHEKEIRDAMRLLPRGSKAQQESLERAADELFKESRSMNLGLNAVAEEGKGSPMYETKMLSEKQLQNKPTEAEEKTWNEIKRKKAVINGVDQSILKSKNANSLDDIAIVERTGDRAGLARLNQGLSIKNAEQQNLKRKARLRLDESMTDEEINEVIQTAELNQVLNNDEIIKNRKLILALDKEKDLKKRNMMYNNLDIKSKNALKLQLKYEIKSLESKLPELKERRQLENFGKPHLVDEKTVLVNPNANEQALTFQKDVRAGLDNAMRQNLAETRTPFGTLVASNPIGTKPGAGFLSTEGNVMKYINEGVIKPIEVQIRHGGSVSADNFVNVLDRLAYINDERMVDAVINSMKWVDENTRKKLRQDVIMRSQYLKLELGRTFNELSKEEQDNVLASIIKAGSVKIDNFYKNIKNIVGKKDVGKSYKGNPSKTIERFGSVGNIMNYNGMPLNGSLPIEKGINLAERFHLPLGYSLERNEK